VHLSPKQTAVLVHGTGSVNLLDGAIRSGKTLAANLAWLRFVQHAPAGQLAIMGKTRDTIGRNVLAGIEELHPSAINWREGSSRCTIMGRSVAIIGANDKQAESKVRGLTLAGAYLDEATLVDKAFFQTLLGRLSVAGSRLYATTNPDTPAHYLNTDYISKVRRRELPGWRIWRFGLDDNPGLTEAYKAKIKRELTGLWFRRMVLGEWVAAEGAVYDMWDPAVHVIPWSQLPLMHRLLAVGVDYGTNNPTRAILLGLSHDGRLYMVDEWSHDGRAEGRWTDNQLVTGLLGWLNQRHLPHGGQEPTVEYIAVDPSAASLQAELYSRHVFNLRAADNRVVFGVQQVASLLHTRKLFVSDRCTGWIDEAPGYSWDDKAALLGVDQVRKVADHSMDAGRYAVATTMSEWRSFVDLTAA
jgi:PBSX family phage terminase large subunit